MASIYELIHSLRGYSYEHLFNIVTSLNTVGFDLRSKREGWVLRHINIDSLPFLDASERATLRYVATGSFLGFFVRLCAATPAVATLVTPGSKHCAKISFLATFLSCRRTMAW